MKNKLQWLKNKKIKYPLIILAMIILVFVSNLYLQWCQNELRLDIVYKFAFSWHTEKFILGCLVLLVFLLFLCSLAGSLLAGSLMYVVGIGLLGFADYQKMLYRTEPIYPDDLKMMTEFGLLSEMIGLFPFIVALLIIATALFFFGKALYNSCVLSKKIQIVRLSGLLVTITLLGYISNFNDSDNLLRKAYNRTAFWIPYSQKMNYYNTGFIGGFLYNLKVEAMTVPKNYSKETIEKINDSHKAEQPNIIFVMSESFSDPQNLSGITTTRNPLKDYYDLAKTTYSGKMLSQNYGGGTANIEFEALTSFSMEPLNAQMTTPYTMLLPKMTEIPSIVSLLKNQQYQTTAIHPYNTSMYKRKDVYQKMAFDQFITEKTMTYADKIENNPYISDESGYKEIFDLLKQNRTPQFIHFVTMQTHMPYENKYVASEYEVQSKGNEVAVANYMKDIAYSSKALKDFTTALNDIERRTLVVFWGDHLPSIYSDKIQDENDETTLHETAFLMYDNKGSLNEKNRHDVITSPFYFTPKLFEQANLQTTGFYQLLSDLNQQLPAFEKRFYYKNQQWSKTLPLNNSQEKLYDEYRLIQYDIVSGKKYSLKNNFFNNSTNEN